MANISAGLAAVMLAQGGSVPINLLELQTISGRRIFLSDYPISLYPALSEFDSLTYVVVRTVPGSNVWPTLYTDANPSAPTVNPADAFDDDPTTSAQLGAGSDLIVYGFPAGVLPSGGTLNVTAGYGVDFSAGMTATLKATVAGVTTDLEPTFGLTHTYTLALAPGVDMSSVSVEATGFADIANIFDIYIQAEATEVSTPEGSAGPTISEFSPWLLDPPQFTFTGTLATATASATFQNLSGNTVERDGTSLFTAEELWGAIFVYRLWHVAGESALFTVAGTVSDVEVDDAQITLSLSDIGNWGEVKAPDCVVGVSCNNVFGSQQCGSNSPTPCQNTYGSCTQLNRFKGVITQWNNTVTSVPAAAVGAVAQPAPNVAINLRRPA